MPVFNYSDYTNELRDIVCSNPIATSAAAANCAASDPVLTFPRIRNNSAYAMDIDEVRNTLEGMTQNAVFGDLAVLRDRQLRSDACSNPIANAVSSNSAIGTAECMSREDRLNAITSSLVAHDIIAGMTQNAVLGDFASELDRPIRRMSRADALRKLQCKLEDNYRKWEVERIKRLISSKATIRYIMEVK